MRGAAEFALKRGVVASVAEAVARADASSEDCGDNSLLACAEGVRPEHFDDVAEKDAALVGCTCELLRKVGERGAVQ